MSLFYCNGDLSICISFQRMHQYAEHGLAAHWLYKETENVLPSKSCLADSAAGGSMDFQEEIENQDSPGNDAFLKYSSLKVGHPVLRVEAGHLLAAVIIRYNNLFVCCGPENFLLTCPRHFDLSE